MTYEISIWDAVLYAVCAVIFFGVLGVTCVVMVNEQRKLHELDVDHLRMFKDTIDQLREDIAVRDEKIKELNILMKLARDRDVLVYSCHDRLLMDALLCSLRETFEPINLLIEDYFLIKSINKPIPKKISSILRARIDMMVNKKFRNDLMGFVDSILGGILYDCIEEIPSIEESDAELMAMRIIGMSPRLIRLIMELTEAEYYPRITNIAEKIASSDLPARQTLLCIYEKGLTT